MSKQKKRYNKGILFRDENVDKSLEVQTREAGWEIKCLPPLERSRGLTDEQVIKKYAKGLSALLTRDYTLYTDNLIEEIPGIIEVATCTSKREFEDYKIVYQVGLSKLNAKMVRNKVWSVPKKGKPFLKVLSISRLQKD